MKGGDRAVVGTSNINHDDTSIDEIVNFQNLRSIGASEGSWRLFQFKVPSRFPSVKRLPVHEKNQESVLFNESSSIRQILDTKKIVNLLHFSTSIRPILTHTHHT